MTYENIRTRIGDVTYAVNNTARIAEIPTKKYADMVAANLTDVSPVTHAYCISLYIPRSGSYSSYRILQSRV